MIYKKQIVLTLLFSFSIVFSFAQTFMVLEKMGTKKRYIYYVGQQIEYQLTGYKSFNRNLITGILDSAFVSHTDTVRFASITKVSIKHKREAGIIGAAGPALISAGVILLAIDIINRGLVQGGDYSLDSGIGTVSAILATTGALIMVLKKDKKKLGERGWWRLRKAEIY